MVGGTHSLYRALPSGRADRPDRILFVSGPVSRPIARPGGGVGWVGELLTLATTAVGTWAALDAKHRAAIRERHEIERAQVAVQPAPAPVAAPAPGSPVLGIAAPGSGPQMMVAGGSMGGGAAIAAGLGLLLLFAKGRR